jgi:adenylate cyclase
MFTDTVGFSAAAHRNEAGALEKLREQDEILRPVIAQHQGRVVKSTGDGLLVEFDSALRATQCAVELQRKLHERTQRSDSGSMSLRIGIHLGDVEERHGDIFGDAVNVAARLEPLAEPGGVCVSRQVFDQVESKVSERFESAGLQQLKGQSRPLEVFRVRMPWSVVPADRPEGRPPRIAVLPLANISPDPRDEYFAEGLTDELITLLSQVRQLRVIARTSVLQFRSSLKSIGQIGSELGVSWILEGSVRKSGDQLRITVQLIDVATEEHLWAQAYDRELQNTFALQAEIAREIATRLPRVIQGRTESESARPLTPASYLAYLRGRTLLRRTENAALDEARREFQRAIELDPRNARAIVGLARVAGREYELHPERSLDRAAIDELSARALEVDPPLAEAHALKAYVLTMRQDWGAGGREYELALSLNPSDWETRFRYAIFLEDLGRTDEAATELELAAEGDPLNPAIEQERGRLLIWQGRFEEAERSVRRLLKLAPRELDALALRFQLAETQGNRSEALRLLASIRPAEESTADRLSNDAAECVLRGDRAALDRLEPELRARLSPDHSAYMLAGHYATLGDLDKAFPYLDEAFARQATGYRWWRLGQKFQAMRADPRWNELIRRYRLPE